MIRVFTVGAFAFLVACTQAACTQAASPSLLEEATETLAPAVNVPILEVVEAVSLNPAPVPAVKSQACRQMAAELIVRWEVTSPAYYERSLSRPIWPKGASGITWGIGYDGGHQTRSTIADDWAEHEQVDRLADTAGITGATAGATLPQYRDIQTPYVFAYQVFSDRSLIEYERQAERAFRVDMREQPAGVCAALVSVTYNRGGSMTGDNRREMRAIRDDCLPSFDSACTARQLRSMCRLWRGTVNERGLCARRDMEAEYAQRVESPQHDQD